MHVWPQHRPARVTRGKAGGLQMGNVLKPQAANESRAQHNAPSLRDNNKLLDVCSRMAEKTCVYIDSTTWQEWQEAKKKTHNGKKKALLLLFTTLCHRAEERQRFDKVSVCVYERPFLHVWHAWWGKQPGKLTETNLNPPFPCLHIFWACWDITPCKENLICTWAL